MRIPAHIPGLCGMRSNGTVCTDTNFFNIKRRLRQRVSFAQFWWYGSLSVRCGIRDRRVGLEKETTQPAYRRCGERTASGRRLNGHDTLLQLTLSIRKSCDASNLGEGSRYADPRFQRPAGHQVRSVVSPTIAASHQGFSRLDLSAARKRAASPPVTAR
jgi:hypothetical protein